jgi:hypothetical protein
MKLNLKTMRRNKINNKTSERFNLKSLKGYFLGGMCAVLAVLSIFMTIESATCGTEVSEIQKKEAMLMSQQQDLQEALVANLSVNSLQEKSSELGFTKVSNLVYVAESVPVARLPGIEVGQ